MKWSNIPENELEANMKEAELETEKKSQVTAKGITIQEHVITGISLPFKDVFILMLKAALAAVPVAMVAGIIYTLVMTLFGSLFMGHY